MHPTQRLDTIKGMRYILKSHRFVITIIILIFMTIVFGFLIVPIEISDPTTTFRNAEDGLWWSFTTVTGVGFGDYYPVTTTGRIIGVILETIGVTIFGLIIAILTINLYRDEQQFYWRRMTERFDRIEEKLIKLEQKQDYSIKTNEKPKKG